MESLILSLLMLLYPSIALAAKPEHPFGTMMKVIVMVLLAAGVGGLIALWRKGYKMASVIIWIVLAIWFIFSIAYKP